MKKFGLLVLLFMFVFISASASAAAGLYDSLAPVTLRYGNGAALGAAGDAFHLRFQRRFVFHNIFSVAEPCAPVIDIAL